MNETINKLIEMLKMQIKIRDDKINVLTRENEVQSIIIKNIKSRYQRIILVLSALLLMSSAITVYNLTF